MDQSTHLGTLLASIVIAIIVVVVVVSFIRKVHRSKRQEAAKLAEVEQTKQANADDLRKHENEDRPVTKWLEGLERIPKDDLEKLSSYPQPPDNFRDRWEDAVDEGERLIEDARTALQKQVEEQQRIDKANQTIRSIKDESDEVAQFIALYVFIEELGLMPYVDDEFSDWAYERQNNQADAMWTILLERARAGDQMCLNLLLAGEFDAWQDKEYPDDWDELIATMVKNPTVNHFGDTFDEVWDELEHGDLRLLASEALSERSLVKAKYVLAIVNTEDRRHNWSEEVGEVRLGLLADMVNEAWNAQHFAKSSPEDVA